MSKDLSKHFAQEDLATNVLVPPAAVDQVTAIPARGRARDKPRFTWGRVLLYLLLLVLLIYAFFPTFWLISTSIKPQLEAFQNPPTWWPHNPTLYSYSCWPCRSLDFWWDRVQLAAASSPEYFRAGRISHRTECQWQQNGLGQRNRPHVRDENDGWLHSLPGKSLPGDSCTTL